MDIDNLTGNISAKKNPCFIIYVSVSPAESPSITPGLRMSVQPAKPASSIGHLNEQYRKVYAFSLSKIFTT